MMDEIFLVPFISHEQNSSLRNNSDGSQTRTFGRDSKGFHGKRGYEKWQEEQSRLYWSVSPQYLGDNMFLYAQLRGMDQNVGGVQRPERNHVTTIESSEWVA